MPRKDNFHETVKIALKKQDWEITNDPLFVPTKGNFNFFIDLGAERIIGAEKISGSRISPRATIAPHFTGTNIIAAEKVNPAIVIYICKIHILQKVITVRQS